MALLLDPEQRFTCQSCGRCCRRGWDIALTQQEVEGYRKAGVERLFSESEGGAEGASRDPFEPVPGHAPFHRIRRRPDGACGFLSKDNRCRIHEELGEARKPLTCQVFPYEFAASGEVSRATASFACPTIVSNLGAPTRREALESLHARFVKAFGEAPHPLAFSPGQHIRGSTLASLKGNLLGLLDDSDLKQGIERAGQYLADLSRHRVQRLAPEAFAEYADIMGRHLKSSSLKPSAPSGLSRFLFRGFLFATLAVRLRLEGHPDGAGLRFRTAWLLLHVHGIGPGPHTANLRILGRARVNLEDPALQGPVRHYLRSAVEGLGTRRPSILEELGFKVAALNAGLVLASLAAAEAGKTWAEAADLTRGLTGAADLLHSGHDGLFPRLLGTLSGAAEALRLLASGRFLGRQVVVYGSGVAAEA
jgi:Fe-S-cluster containining protein